MMKKIICLLIVLSIPIIGCDDFLNEEVKTFTNSKTLMQSASGIEQAVNGIYAAGWDYYRYRYCVMIYGNPTDEMWMKTSSGTRWQISVFDWQPSNDDLKRPWVVYTSGISRANMVLDNLPPLGSLKIAGEKEFLDYKKGEALFLRAHNYFYQMMTYGPAPLLTSFNNAELFPANSTIPELYAQIIADLIEAETLLPNWKDNIHVPGRASRGAAKALLGRVYLTKATSEAKASDDFQKAASKLKDVIDNEGYDLWTNYYEVFIPANKNKKEDIFSFQCETNGANISALYIEFTPQPPPTGATRGYAQLLMTNVLYNSFEPGDKRKEDGYYGTPMIFTGDYIVRSTGQMYTTDRICHEKYLDPVNGPLTHNNQSTNFPLIRYADVLLMYAEAVNEVNNGPNLEAYNAINKVRTRAGLPSLGGLSKTQFFDAIKMERYHELFHEAIRWFDLKRWGILKERVEARGIDPPYLPPIDVQIPKHLVFPIPQSEISANPNLVQNPGY